MAFLIPQIGHSMSYMRLGTRIAVINDDNQILLSKRGDFGSWGLPGGRVDSGELIHESAIREVREETGLDVEIERPVGLYFQQGRSRMNILYRAKLIGGELFGKTDETLDNRFFAPDNLPENLFGKFYIDHAYSNKTYLHTLETSFWELFKLDMKLRWRWIQNLLAGRPEPKFAEFDMTAVGILTNRSRNQIITFGDETLPRVEISGKRPPHEELVYFFHINFDWQWVGLWQDTGTNRMEFVFWATDTMVSNAWVKEKQLIHERDRRYLQSLKKQKSKIWLLKA